jgi:phosphotransferase system IIA component
MLLWIHTIRPEFKFLARLLNIADGPHPWHFTLREVRELLKAHFQIETLKVVNGLGFDGKSEDNMKVRIGNHIMLNAWIIARLNTQ